MRRQRTYLLALATLLAGCADHADPLASTGSPRANSFYPTPARSVTDYWYPGDTDWSDALQRAVDDPSAAAVYLPAGQYRLAKQVEIRRAIPVYGDGRASLIRQDTTVLGQNFNVLLVTAAGASVRKLGFEGMGRTVHNNGYAVKIQGVGGVTVDSIHADWIGLAFADHAQPGTVIKNSKGEARVLYPWQNRGVEHGIQITNSHGVEVAGDTLYRYGNGIEWWGSWELPTTGHLIRDNIVHESGNAIWGAGGQNIRVENNEAFLCEDFCFDTEDGRNITFIHNRGGYAGTAVLGVKYRGDSIVFQRNRVSQNNSLCAWYPRTSCWAGHPERGAERTGNRLFSIQSGRETDYPSIRVYSINNRFEHETHIGWVDKAPSTLFSMQNDSLSNTVAHLQSGRNGRVSLTGLNVRITRNTAYPGIKVGSHEYEPISGTAVHVAGNRVERSTNSPSSTPGIDVYMRGWYAHSAVITDNVVHRYDGQSIAAHSDDVQHSFTITHNRTTGPILVWGSPHPATNMYGNFRY